MLEMLDQNMLWWHWVILGFVLLVIELSTGTFFILGLAVASVMVGLLDLWFETHVHNGDTSVAALFCHLHRYLV